MKNLFNISISKFILAITVILASVHVGAQDIYVDIECTNQYPGVGEQIKISYVLKLKMNGGMASISHSGIKIKKPSMSGLNVTQEGNESTGFSFGGGGKDMKLSKYSFIAQPTKKGTVKIDPFTFVMNGESYTSDSFTLKVGEGDPKAKIIPQNSNYFLRIEISKSDLYIGEHALVTYKLYSHYSNISITNYDFPMANGLWKEEIKTGSKGWPQTQETIGGKAYLVIPLKKEIIFAQKTGKVEIPGITVDLSIGGGFFSQGTKETIKSNSPTLNVKPLPQGAPESFDNQVGKNYKLEMSYSTNQLKSGDALDVKIKIKGDGNIKKLNAPVLEFPSDFEVFDAEIQDNIKTSTSGTSGSKDFSYLVIPRHHGSFEIPEFNYSYFDLSSKSYKTLTFPAQTLEVSKGDNESVASTNSFNSNKEEVEVLNNEIRHINVKTNLQKSGTYFFKSTSYWLGLCLPPLAFIGTLLFLGLKPKEVDLSKVAKKNASKKAFKTLAAADICLQSKDDLGFYEALYKGMLDYLSNKFTVSTASLSKENIKDTLLNNKIDENLTAQFMSILDECEMARFAPITHSGAQQTMDKTKSIIQNIEKNAK
jgi:hypothetical protein